MPGAWEFMCQVIRALNDVDNMDPDSQRSWRRLVAALITVLCVGSMLGIFWAQGWLPGISGVALADDLKTFKQDVAQKQASLEKKQDGLALLIVKGAIRNALNDRCTALDRHNQDALSGANTNLEDLADQYQQLTGREWRPPDCRVVLIDPAGTLH